MRGRPAGSLPSILSSPCPARGPGVPGVEGVTIPAMDGACAATLRWPARATQPMSPPGAPGADAGYSTASAAPAGDLLLKVTYSGARVAAPVDAMPARRSTAPGPVTRPSARRRPGAGPASARPRCSASWLAAQYPARGAVVAWCWRSRRTIRGWCGGAGAGVRLGSARPNPATRCFRPGALASKITVWLAEVARGVDLVLFVDEAERPRPNPRKPWPTCCANVPPNLQSSSPRAD